MTFGFSFFQVLCGVAQRRELLWPRKLQKSLPKTGSITNRTLALCLFKDGKLDFPLWSPQTKRQKRLESLVCFFVIILAIVFWRMVEKFRPSEISWGIFSAVVVKSGALHRGKTAFFLYSLCILVVVCWCIRSILSLGQSFKLQKQYFTSNWLRGDKHYGDSVWDMHILVVVCV